MIDFHTHILPAIDDGSEDLQESLDILKTCKERGVSTVILTSHCHPMSQFHIDKFTELRDIAYTQLTSAIKKEKLDLPRLVRASEVRIYDNLHKYKGIEDLCIEGTNYILLEMPYERWRDYAFEEIYQLYRRGFHPIMAHLDRFLDQEELFREMYSFDVLVQMNSSAFFNKAKRRKMLDFFEAGHLQVIGSDTHDLSDRPPNVDEAFKVIENKFGSRYVDYLDYAGNAILNNEEVNTPKFAPMNIFKKLMI